VSAGDHHFFSLIALISMASAQISGTLPDAPSIQLVGHLPARLAERAADLYLCALADQLVPIYGAGPRARRALASGFNRHMCICAVAGDRLIGILGVQTAAADFLEVTLSSLQPFYGIPGSLWRMALLALLHHSPVADEVHIDGVVVAPAYRGQGVGAAMITSLAAWATGRGLSMLTLEVVDANPQAKRLYRHLGFESVREQTVWPVGSLFGFRSSTVMIKALI
jgi:ribosomal protein S18 acetylase RimI-like enzyme